VPAWQTASLAAAALFAVISTGSYRSVERVAIAVGLCELAFIALAWLARPELGQIRAQLLDMPFGDRDYLYLLAANLGTCVIPWAIFYQQSASIDKGLTRAHLAGARAETLAGAVLCQVITAAVLVAAASALHGAVGLHGAAGPHPLDRIGDIADAFTATIGPDAGRIVFAVGLSGGALVAGIIVCLTAGWALGEVLGRRPSIAASPAEAPWFYGALAVVLAFSVALVASGANLVRLSLAVGVLNALLLPIVLGFVFHFARRQLPEELRLRGGYALTVGCVFALTAGLGLVASVVGLL